MFNQNIDELKRNIAAFPHEFMLCAFDDFAVDDVCKDFFEVR